MARTGTAPTAPAPVEGVSPVAAPPRDEAGAAGPARPSRPARPSDLAAVVGVVGILVLVGRAGEPGWQLVRLIVVAVAGVLVIGVRRRGGPPAVAVSWAAGLAATAAGLGVGVPHLAKDGGIVPIVAAGACLVGGLVLLVAAVVHLVRSAPRWWRLAVAPIVGLPTVVLLATATIAVAATNVPPTPLDGRTPADVGLASEDVSVPTAEGPVLSGWYVPSRDGAAVVVLHGAGSTRTDVLDHAVVLARHGLGVLLLDARGHGRSEGTAMDLGWWGDSDVAAAVTFLRGRPDVDDDRIGAVGLSMGGEEALGALGADPRLRAVVAEGATGRVAGDDAWLADVHGWRGSVQGVISRVRDATVAMLTDAPAPGSLRSAVAAAGPRRALVIAGGDVPDEGDVARDLQRTAPAVVEVWVVPGSGHTAGLATRPAEWEQRVVRFLEAQLGR
ncbi:hypothetical protein HC251_14620 [Iamia sp. SCSIO 61187]|uniref:alpha/beta hydrolase n=1 Tax=Iamia sp. SCSIO 61187 TaxID=2722752 RepID=UPI001C62CB27|nr:alpha/beta fold hydrolase [Iamia sp. SCSIO 61187]QYG93537.1 hypothetical protein HC251_14620 [Iamia sp. SCSIO 61187]